MLLQRTSRIIQAVRPARSHIQTYRRFSQAQPQRKESWLGMGVMLTMLLSGTYYITSDHFLSQLVRKVLKDAAKSTETDTNKWQITFKKAEGCFLCGAMRFTDVHYKRTWQEEQTESSIDANFDTVAIYMDVISLLKKLYWDKSGDIHVPRFGAVNITGNLSITNIEQHAPSVPKFHFLVGNGRIKNAQLYVELNDGSHKQTHQVHIDDFKTADYLSLSSLFTSVMLRSELQGNIDSYECSSSIEGKNTPIFKNSLKLSNIPVDSIIAYYNFLQKQTTTAQSSGKHVSIEIETQESDSNVTFKLQFNDASRSTFDINIPDLSKQNGRELQKLALFKIVEISL
jgi:hypothetical protein